MPTTFTWTGNGTDDLWSNPANWDIGVPVDGADVRIAATANSAEVLFDGTVPGGSVALRSLTSDGTTPVSEPFRITGATLTLSGAGPFAVGAGFDNGGLVNVGANTTFTVTNGGTSTGDWDVNATGALNFTTGTYLLDDGTDITGAGATVVKSNGLVNVGDAAADVVNISNLILGPAFDAGTVNATGTLQVTGRMDVGSSISTGFLTGSGNVTVGGLLTLGHGAMSGSGTTSANGGLSLQIGGGGFELKDGRHLDNNAPATWASNNGQPLSFRNGAVFNNNSVFDVQVDSQMANGNQGGDAANAINNTGIFKKTAGNGITDIRVPFNNSNTGTVDVQTGEFDIRAGGTSTGPWTVVASAIVDFFASYDHNAGSTLSGAGTVRFDGGTVNLADTYSVDHTEFIFGGTANFNATSSTITLSLAGSSTLGGVGDFTVNGLFGWFGGDITGTHTVFAKGDITLNILSGNSHFIGRTLDLASNHTLTWLNGSQSILFSDGAVFNNNGAFDAQADVGIGNGGGAASTFNNFGTFKKTAGNGLTNVNVPFNNVGTVEPRSGTLNLANAAQVDAATSTLTGGTWKVFNDATLKLNADVPLASNNATVVLNGGNSSFTNLANLAANGGSFTIQNGRDFTAAAFINTGTVTVGSGSTFTAAGGFTQSTSGILSGTGAVAANVTSDGQVNPGASPGFLTINGDYTQRSSGAFNVEIAGATAGSQFDQLAVSGNVDLNGALIVSLIGGFVPLNNASFRILDNTGAGGVNGAFAGLPEGTIFAASGRNFRISYVGGTGNDVVLTEVNVAPVLANIESSAFGYTENDPPTQVTNTITVADVDSANLTGATATISAGFNAAQDVLSFNLTGTSITGSYNSSTGVLTFTGSDTLAHYQTVLRSVAYQNLSNNPTTTNRVVTFQVDDGQADNHASNTQSRTINVTALNAAPVLSGIEGSTLAYTENDAPTQVTGTLTVSDVDNSNLARASVSITSGFSSVQDVLSFNVTGTNIAGNYNSGTGVLTFTGSDTLAHYQTVLRSVTYQNLSDNPTTTNRVVTFQVDDGQSTNNLSNSVTRDIQVTAANDAPALTNIESSAIDYSSTSPAVRVTATLTVNDFDSTNLAEATATISSGFASAEDELQFDASGTSITGSYDSATGILTLRGTAALTDYQAVLRSVRYFNRSNTPSTVTRTIRFQVSDGESANWASNTQSRAINISAPAGQTDIFVVGSDGGTEATVKIYDAASGAHTATLVPFAGFTGGVRVATGDLNGDGVKEIITAAGPGGGPHVRIFDGRTLAQLPGVIGSFFAFDAGFAGGVYVAVGDVDHDGSGDVVAGAGAGRPEVRVFRGSTGAEIRRFLAYSENFPGGVRVASGDFDKDGFADIITGAGPGGGPHVRAISGANGNELASFYAYDPLSNAGIYVAAGDVDGDGHADIITGAGAGGLPQVLVISGADQSLLHNYLAYGSGFTGGVRVGTVDADGDGRLDLLTGAGTNGGPHLKAFRSTDELTLQSFFALDPAFLGGIFVG